MRVGTLDGAFLGLAFLAAGTTAAAAQEAFERPYWLDRSVIEVIGRAQIEVQPDEARFSVTFREVARDSLSATQGATDRARLATAAIRSRGGDAVEINSSADIDAIYEEYRNREGDRQSSERADQIANYSVSVTLDITVKDIARAANVRAAAMAVGPEEAGDLGFVLRETAPAMRRAYGSAVEDAAARARISAQASGAQLGRLLVLQEGQGPCLGHWVSAPSRTRNLQNTPVTQATESGDEIIVTGSRIGELRLSAQDIARMQLPEDLGPILLSAQVCAIYAVAP